MTKSGSQDPYRTFSELYCGHTKGGLTHHGQGTHQYGCSYLVDKLIAWMCMYLFHTHLLISLPSTTKAFFKLLSQGGVFLSLFFFNFFCQFCDGPYRLGISMHAQLKGGKMGGWLP